MIKHDLKFRQVHLDFHTHGSIKEIGINFNAEEFSKNLKDAHVDSITLFARCHHGWLYYNSNSFPEMEHPHLSGRNLLSEQIEACHAAGIKAPVYTTVQWDEQIAHKHYDWLSVDETGAPFKQPPFKAGFYRNICVNSPYVEYFKAHIKDLFDSLGVLDGLFLDILNVKPCCCNNCLDEMRKKGLDASDESVRYAFAQEVFDRFQLDITSYIHSLQKGCPVFYNVGYIGTQHRNALPSFTHLEIESLPGGSWGYDHFPVTARYARTLGLDTMGMTGKFHTDWGDFGSLRNNAALEYECFKSLAYGAKCSIGDQLHPSGAINKATYELIGSVYKSVEQKEPWCRGAKPIVEAAVFASSEYKRVGTQLVTPELTGAVKLMSEIGIQFDVIDSTADLSQYKLLVLPDELYPLTDAFSQKLFEFSQNGGAIISSARSGIEKSSGKAANWLPAEIDGDAPYCPDYLDVKDYLGAGLAHTEFVMYEKAVMLSAKAGSKEIIGINKPWFNRTWEHYCGHRHAPSTGEYGYPGIIKGVKIYQFAHPIFTIYEKFSPRWIKQIFKNAVYDLIGHSLVSHNGPSTLELSLMSQKEENRMVLHALHYIPIRKSTELDIIEDIIPIYDTAIDINSCGKQIKAVRIIPEGKAIEFIKHEASISFNLPKISGHTMVEILY